MLCMNGPTESLHMVKKSCCTHVMDAHGCSPCRMAATPRLRLWLLMALPLAALVVLCHTVPIPSTVHTIASALSTLLTANSSSCVPLRIVIALLSMTEKWCTRLVMTLAISTWKGSTSGPLKAERARVSASASPSSMTCLETSSPPHCQAWLLFKITKSGMNMMSTMGPSESFSLLRLPLLVSQISMSWLPLKECTSKMLPKKIKAIFQQQHTNNEQLVIRACGIINGCGTMYNHEAVSNVLVCDDDFTHAFD